MLFPNFLPAQNQMILIDNCRQFPRHEPGRALFGRPAPEGSLEALPFELVLDGDSGISIAVRSDGHSVEAVGATPEHKRWKRKKKNGRPVTLTQPHSPQIGSQFRFA